MHYEAVWTLDPSPERSRYLSSVQGYGLRLNVGEYDVINDHVYVTAEFFVRLATYVCYHGALPRRHRLPWQRDQYDQPILSGLSDANGYRFAPTPPQPPLDQRFADLKAVLPLPLGRELTKAFDSGSRSRKRSASKAITALFGKSPGDDAPSRSALKQMKLTGY